MTRLAGELDLAEIRLRLDVGGGIGVPRIKREDVRRLLDEVAECWAGNLPEWADGDTRILDWDDDDPLPSYVVTRLETLADEAEAKFRALGACGFGSASAAWREISESIWELLENIENDDPCRIEKKEEARCDATNVFCGEARDRGCAARPDPG